MEAVPGEEFLRWASVLGVGLDPRYADSGYLRLLPPGDHARFWMVPADPTVWPHFVAELLDGLDSWASGYVWPRCGRWPEHAKPLSHNAGVRDVILRGAGIPAGWVGAIRFDCSEADSLLAVLFAYLAFGWCGDDDLFFIPDHGRQLVQTDHHDVVHAECRSEDRIVQLVAHMAHAGYELPTEPPDWTFRRPAWMIGGNT